MLNNENNNSAKEMINEYGYENVMNNPYLSNVYYTELQLDAEEEERWEAEEEQ